jgi:hypothetical protein
LLELFRADDREEQIDDQAERDESDDVVFHIRRGVLDLLAGPHEGDHEAEESNGGEDV